MGALPMVVQVVDAIGGRNPAIFSRKRLTKSDCDPRQNRYLFHDEDVRNFIIPQLTEEEMVRAHLPLGIELNDDANPRDQGLQLDLYINGNLGLEMFQTVLIRRPSKGVVLKGHGWNSVVTAGNLAPGDHVVLWSFRRLENDKLCLFICKI